MEEEEEPLEQYFPTAGGESTYPSVTHVTMEQQKDLLEIIPKGLFRDQPGRTGGETRRGRQKQTDPETERGRGAPWRCGRPGP